MPYACARLAIADRSASVAARLNDSILTRSIARPQSIAFDSILNVGHVRRSNPSKCGMLWTRTTGIPALARGATIDATPCFQSSAFREPLIVVSPDVASSKGIGLLRYSADALARITRDGRERSS